MTSMLERIVVVRHARSDYPPGVGDHERPLNARGRRDAPEIGQWLDTHLQWSPGAAPRVLVSSAVRAQLTWSLASTRLAERWDECDVATEPRIYEASVRAMVELLNENVGVATVVLVGHNPGLAGLIMDLAVEDERSVEATTKFPTSAVAVLELDAGLTAGQWRVASFVVPRGTER